MINSWQKGDKRELIHTFSEDDIKRFVQLSGDDNPLHVDAESARKSAAGGVVVHGMLAAAFISTLIGKKIPGPGALWNEFSVKWLNPIRIGDTINFQASVLAVHHSTNILKLAITGTTVNSGKTVLEGTANVMLLDQAKETALDMELSGKRILITGASGVVGAAVADRLLKAGADLVLLGRNGDELQKIADVNRKQGTVAIVQVDLSQQKQITSIMRDLTDSGNFFSMVHVASPKPNLLSVVDPDNLEELARQWRINVAAFVQIASHITPTMDKGGAVLAVLTQALLTMPPEKMSAYIAAKSALLSLVKSMAVELGPKGVRCVAVSPGMMNTPFSEFAPVSAKKIEAARTPLRRLCTPEDVANSVHFLLGAESSFINGINLPVTGGLH